MTLSLKILVAVGIAVLVWTHGFHTGKMLAEADYTRQAAQVAKQAEDASQRASQALSDISATIKSDDLSLAAIEDGLIHEETGPDTCSVGAGRLLRLDQIR